MRTVVAAVYSSMDGVIQRPEKWSLAYFNDEAAAYQMDLLSRSDVVLQGRATYEMFTPHWNRPSEDAYNQRMYEIPKVLVSRTTAEGAWNNTTVTSDPVSTVRELKQDGDGHVLTYGFGGIANDLLDAGLLDEVHLWVHPVLARVGTAEDLLFRPGPAKVPFAHVATRTLGTGVTILRLAVERR